ncbi:apolipoprotein N-acyltransferase [Rickettsiales bacterium LUAb2]
MTSRLSIALGSNSTFVSIRKYIIALVLGMAIVAALPPLYFVVGFPVAFAGLSALYHYSKSLKQAIWLGFFSGFGFGTVSFYWFYYAINYSIGSNIISGLAVVVSALIISLFFIAIAVASYFTPKNKVWLLLIFNTGLWSSVELIRGELLFGGLPWNIIAEFWDFDIYMLQTAAIVGVYGLGFITCFIMGSLLIFFNKNSSNRDRWLSLLIVGALLIGLHAYGYYRVALYKNISDTNNLLAVVQPNISQSDKMTGYRYQYYLNNLQKLTSSLTSSRFNLTIIWPETSMLYDEEDKSDILTNLKQYLHNNATLIAGVQREDKGNYYNSVLIYNPYGNFVAYYDKNHLVPFGEYIPLLSSFKQLSSVVGDFSFNKGTKQPIFNIDYLPAFKVLICFEAIFSNRELNNKNVKFIVNVANDAWYDNTFEPYQHLSLIRFRAIEGGVPVIRSANSGISVIIDSVGNIKKHIPLFTQGVMLAKLPKVYPSSTIFSSIGNYLIIGIDSVILLVLLYCIAKEYDWFPKKI